MRFLSFLSVPSCSPAHFRPFLSTDWAQYLSTPSSLAASCSSASVSNTSAVCAFDTTHNITLYDLAYSGATSNATIVQSAEGTPDFVAQVESWGTYFDDGNSTVAPWVSNSTLFGAHSFHFRCPVLPKYLLPQLYSSESTMSASATSTDLISSTSCPTSLTPGTECSRFCTKAERASSSCSAYRQRRELRSFSRMVRRRLLRLLRMSTCALVFSLHLPSLPSLPFT